MPMIRSRRPVDSFHAKKVVRDMAAALFDMPEGDANVMQNLDPVNRAVMTFIKIFTYDASDHISMSVWTMQPEISSWSFPLHNTVFDLTQALMKRQMMSMTDCSMETRGRVRITGDFVGGPSVSRMMEGLANELQPGIDMMRIRPSNVNLSYMPLLFTTISDHRTNETHVMGLKSMRAIELNLLVELHSGRVDDRRRVPLVTVDQTDDIRMTFMPPGAGTIKVFGRGVMQYLGPPDKVYLTFKAFRETLISVMSGRSSKAFLRGMIVLDSREEIASLLRMRDPPESM
jgi:hypothetical protein